MKQPAEILPKDDLFRLADFVSADRHKALNEYFLRLPNDSFPDPGPLSRQVGSAEVPVTGDHDGKVLTCSTTHWTLQANPDKLILFDPDRDVTWPGALVQGTSLLKIGSLRELPIRKRAPLPLTVVLLSDHTSVVVPKPSLSTVMPAVGKIISDMKATGDLGSAITFDMKETLSSRQAMLELGISVSHGGFDVSATHSAVTTEKTSVVTAYFMQRCFTVTADNPETPADLFSSDFSMQDVKDQERYGRIGPANVPVMLSSVTFGRILYLTISSSSSSTDLKNALTSSFNVGSSGGKVDLDQKSKTILTNAEISASAIGIEMKNWSDLIRTGGIRDVFAKDMQIQSAWPISYLFRNLSNLSIAGLTDTASYDVTICTPEIINALMKSHCDAVDANILNYHNFLNACAGNIDDQVTRELRGQQAKYFNGEVDYHLQWLIDPNNRKQFSQYSVTWLHGWCTTVQEKIQSNIREWRNQAVYGDGRNRGIFNAGLGDSATQSNLVTKVAA